MLGLAHVAGSVDAGVAGICVVVAADAGCAATTPSSAPISPARPTARAPRLSRYCIYRYAPSLVRWQPSYLATARDLWLCVPGSRRVCPCQLSNCTVVVGWLGTDRVIGRPDWTDVRSRGTKPALNPVSARYLAWDGAEPERPRAGDGRRHAAPREHGHDLARKPRGNAGRRRLRDRVRGDLAVGSPRNVRGGASAAVPCGAGGCEQCALRHPLRLYRRDAARVCADAVRRTGGPGPDCGVRGRSGIGSVPGARRQGASQPLAVNARQLVVCDRAGGGIRGRRHRAARRRRAVAHRGALSPVRGRLRGLEPALLV